ncbi:MAG: YggT family protein [Chloroflexota bacterium]
MEPNLTEERTTEIREEVIREGVSGNGTGHVTPIERHERVAVTRGPGLERHERLIEDIGAERRLRLQKVTQFITWVMGGLEALIGLRILLRLIAANPNSPFVGLVYRVSSLFLWPFQNLAREPSAGGMVLEISSIVAMIVYALLGWAVVSLIWLIFTPSSARTFSVYQKDKH